MTDRCNYFIITSEVASCKEGWIVLDQIRIADKKRLIKKVGRLEQETVITVKSVIQEMLVD